MKKFGNFLRSMRFGLILMVFILILSLAGSLIPQAKEAEYYLREYGAMGPVIVRLRLDDVFSAWYFIAVMTLLCLNLTLCSVVRLKSVLAASRRFPSMTVPEDSRVLTQTDDIRRLKTYLEQDRKITPHSGEGFPFVARNRSEGVLEVRRATSDEAADEKTSRYGMLFSGIALEKNRFKKKEADGRTVYYKNRIGFFGSFLTHLSLLLILVFGFAALYFAESVDQTILPGETHVFNDGTSVQIVSFDLVDGDGRLDFRSVIRVTASDGSESGEAEISVNHPFSFAGHKFYQQTYATAGRITVEENGESSDFILREPCALADENGNGVFFMAVYPGWIENTDGSMTLITSTQGVYDDPVYSLLKMENGANTPIMAMPGERVEVGEAAFIPQAPVPYPGLRVKSSPAILTAFLYAAFILMTVGLWLCFFVIPTAVTVFADGYALASPKAIDIRSCLKTQSVVK